jgi:UDP-glucose 4-epimerase
VYGIPKTTPIPETSVVNPINPYGRSKAFCEQLITDSARAYRFSAVTLRYFNACGADSRGRHGQEPDATHIFARIFEAIKHNRPIEIYGNEYPTRDGTCVRDYIHVMDLAEAHRRALEKSLPPSNHIFNLGTRHGYSVLEIVNRIKDILKSDAIVEFRAPRAGDPPELIASSESFKNFFEWEPTHSDLNTIIKSLKKWYHV